jgi:ribonuclease Z
MNLNKFQKAISLIIVGLVMGTIFTSCQTKESKNEVVKTEEIKTVSNFNPQDYRFPREEGITKGGYPVTLSGQPITKTPLIVKTDESKIREYPKHFIPGNEVLATDEMRITIMGSGTPAPIRAAQGTSCVLVQLGNGDTFIFDIGSGTVGNLFSMGIHPSELDKVFITHFHLDHIGGIFPLFDAMGWARNTPLRVWGPSGHTPELGTAAFIDNIYGASEWHRQAKQDILPVEGASFDTKEIDISLFNEDNPQQLVYDNDGVKIYAFPVVHSINGAIGFRLEWKGLSMSYVSDSQVSSFEVEQSKGVDVLIHEVMPSAEAFAKGNNMSIEDARSVIGHHTTPSKLGYFLGLTKPKLGVGTHFKLGDETNDDLFSDLRKIYKGPFLLAQDLSTINITPDYILMRQTKINLLADPPPPAKSQENLTLTIKEHSDAEIPEWLEKTVIVLEE